MILQVAPTLPGWRVVCQRLILSKAISLKKELGRDPTHREIWEAVTEREYKGHRSNATNMLLALWDARMRSRAEKIAEMRAALKKVGVATLRRGVSVTKHKDRKRGASRK